MPKPTSFADIHNLTPEQRQQLNRAAGFQIAKFIAIKVAIAVTVHLAVNALVSSMDDDEE